MSAKIQGSIQRDEEQKKGGSQNPHKAVDTNSMQNDEDKQLQDKQEREAKIDMNQMAEQAQRQGDLGGKEYPCEKKGFKMAAVLWMVISLSMLVLGILFRVEFLWFVGAGTVLTVLPAVILAFCCRFSEDEMTGIDCEWKWRRISK